MVVKNLGGITGIRTRPFHRDECFLLQKIEGVLVKWRIKELKLDFQMAI